MAALHRPVQEPGVWRPGQVLRDADVQRGPQAPGAEDEARGRRLAGRHRPAPCTAVALGRIAQHSTASKSTGVPPASSSTFSLDRRTASFFPPFSAAATLPLAQLASCALAALFP